MTPQDEEFLLALKQFKKVGTMVAHMKASGFSATEAWLFAGAIMSYTGNSKIPDLIMDRTVPDSAGIFVGKVGEVNNALRLGHTRGPTLDALIALMARGIRALPDWTPRAGDVPTRMIDHYPNLAVDYAVGNLLVMAEVGSVGRSKPPTGSTYYQKRYRLEYEGGLKDIFAFNEDQQEVIYAPGSIYQVVSAADGKVKPKKGPQGAPQAHMHISLLYVAAPTAANIGAARDLRFPAMQVQY